jgi:deoxyribose-phosphate aldolase
MENLEALIARVTQEVLAALHSAPALEVEETAAEGLEARTVFAAGRVLTARVGKAAAPSALEAGVGLEDIARLIDHTLLKPEATAQQIAQLCAEAREYRFASVCVNPWYVRLAADLLSDVEEVEVCTVVGFPLGATVPQVKAYEALQAIADGATEVDMVINIGAQKSKRYDAVARDIRAVVQAAHGAGALVKVIIEAALLTDEEKVAACLLAKQAKAAALHDYASQPAGNGTNGRKGKPGSVFSVFQFLFFLEKQRT